MTDKEAQKKVRPPFNPYLVLAIAIALPGMGQVLNDQPNRGLLFVFTTLALGFVTAQYAPSEANFFGRYAGGIFIYAIAVMDAYRWARIRWQIFYRDESKSDGPGGAAGGP
jgi:hypothetical protein